MRRRFAIDRHRRLFVLVLALWTMGGAIAPACGSLRSACCCEAADMPCAPPTPSADGIRCGTCAMGDGGMPSVLSATAPLAQADLSPLTVVAAWVAPPDVVHRHSDSSCSQPHRPPPRLLSTTLLI